MDWSGYNNYYYSLFDSESIISDLAFVLRDTVSYVQYQNATNIDITNTTKGGQYILYDDTDIVIPLGGWPSGGNYTIDNYGTYSVDREHIWACSNMRIMPSSKSRSLSSYVDYEVNDGSFDYRPEQTNKGHFSDMHNLWSAARYANQTLHSDHFFGERNGTSKSPYLQSGAFYPGEEFIGDIARVLFYMTLMYPHLTLVDEWDANAIEGTIYYGYLNTLLEWNIQDPVSLEEIARNQAIFDTQGNRNPFVDFYSQRIASLIFENGDPNVL